MKKLFSCLLPFALLLSCQQPTASVDPYVAPDMGRAADIPSVGATSAPVGKAEAVAAFTDALNANYYSAGSAPKSALASRAAASMTFELGPAIAGVTVNGSLKIDASRSPEPPKVGSPATFTTNATLDLVATLSNVAVTATKSVPGPVSYTVNGKLDFSTFLTVRQVWSRYAELVSGTEPNTVRSPDFSKALMDLAVKSGFGAALSIKDAAGKGAKYILSCSVAASATGLGQDAAPPAGTFSSSATLSVYNDATNAPIGTYTLTEAEFAAIVGAVIPM